MYLNFSFCTYRRLLAHRRCSNKRQLWSWGEDLLWARKSCQKIPTNHKCWTKSTDARQRQYKWLFRSCFPEGPKEKWESFWWRWWFLWVTNVETIFLDISCCCWAFCRVSLIPMLSSGSWDFVTTISQKWLLVRIILQLWHRMEHLTFGSNSWDLNLDREVS